MDGEGQTNQNGVREAYRHVLTGRQAEIHTVRIQPYRQSVIQANMHSYRQ